MNGRSSPDEMPASAKDASSVPSRYSEGEPGLPADANAYRGNGWLLGALAHVGAAILVFPQGARDNDADPEYLNWGAGRGWETYVAEEVPRYVDAHFRTIRSRAGRALVGVSAGGYGATILGLHHLESFSVLESWSGYFHPTDPTGTAPLARGPAANAHTLVAALRSSQRRRPTFLDFYVGRGDTRFLAENVQFNRELTAAGVRHIFEVYRGAHETSLWAAHAQGWLALTLAQLAKPTA
jgi:enterochelin esterase-like enzyme